MIEANERNRSEGLLMMNSSNCDLLRMKVPRFAVEKYGSNTEVGDGTTSMVRERGMSPGSNRISTFTSSG